MSRPGFRERALWLALALAFAGLLANGGFCAGVPGRFVQWLSLLLTVAAVALLAVGVVQLARTSATSGRKVLGWIAALVALAAVGISVEMLRAAAAVR